MANLFLRGKIYINLKNNITDKGIVRSLIFLPYIVKDFDIFVIYNHKNNVNKNNMKTINCSAGQIIYCKSDDCWIYISVLHNAQPQNASGAMQLHTCCDLSIDGDDGSKTMTFAHDNGTLLDVDTTFEEVREAANEEKIQLFDALVKAFKDYDLGWDKHFTDSTYDDIRDWLCWEFEVDLDNMDNNNPLGVTIYEITNYIWDALCRETGNYQACTDYVEPEMVNKQEFIEKVRNWLEKHTYDDKYWTSEGDDLFLGNLIDELVKYLEE